VDYTLKLTIGLKVSAALYDDGRFHLEITAHAPLGGNPHRTAGGGLPVAASDAAPIKAALTALIAKYQDAAVAVAMRAAAQADIVAQARGEHAEVNANG
jgi:hypothetical protein